MPWVLINWIDRELENKEEHFKQVAKNLRNHRILIQNADEDFNLVFANLASEGDHCDTYKSNAESLLGSVKKALGKYTSLRTNLDLRIAAADNLAAQYGKWKLKSKEEYQPDPKE